MSVINYNHGKFFSPSLIYSGYFFILSSLIAVVYSPGSLFLLIPGTFMAFTYSGTIINTDKKTIRPYTNLFGIIRAGKYVNVSDFTRFSIQNTHRRYTAHSRGQVRLDIDIYSLDLLLLNHNGKRKIIINRYPKFEQAQKEKERLGEVLFPDMKTEKNHTSTSIQSKVYG
jgi:hypothetical protein